MFARTLRLFCLFALSAAFIAGCATAEEAAEWDDPIAASAEPGDPLASMPEDEPAIGETDYSLIMCPDHTWCDAECDAIGMLWNGRCSDSGDCTCQPPSGGGGHGGPTFCGFRLNGRWVCLRL